MADWVPYHARLPRVLYEQLRKKAYEEHTTMNKLIADALRDYLDKADLDASR